MSLSETLGAVMRRAGVGSQTLSKLTGIPRTAIDNWRDGTVRRPRHWRPLLQIARVLSLSRAEADELLAAAGYPAVRVLVAEVAADHADHEYLSSWLPAPVPVSPRYQLRAPTADFTGRADVLAVLEEALRGAGAAVVGVRGMGGVGKTELALLAASRGRDAFPDAQLMVALRGVSAAPLPVAQALRQVIHAFAPDARLDEDVESLRRHYCSVLAGRRVLIIADDAGDAAQVRPLLPPPGSALLVTSRLRFALPGMTMIDLAPLAEDEAVRLLVAICDRLAEPDARSIARACGYLPLALRIGAGVLANDPALPVAEQVAALADRRLRLARLRDPDDAELDLATSLRLSYDRLDEPDRAVFRQLGALVGDFGTELATATVAVPEGVEVAATLRLLLRRNLAGYDSVRDRWHLHALVRDLARDHLEHSGELDDTMRRYAGASLRTVEAIHERYRSGGDGVPAALMRFDLERSHVDAARSWATAHAGSEAADRFLVADATATFHQIGFMRYDRRTDMIPQARTALAAARRLGDRTGEAVVLNRLGQLHLDLGEVAEAVVHLEQQHILARAAGDLAAQARAINNLGLAYLRLGEPRRAIPLYDRQLDLVRELGDPRGEAMARCNLGHARLALGDASGALAALTPALVAAQALGDRYGETAVLHGLGLAHLAAGDPPRAAEVLARALAVARELGDRHAESRVLAGLARAAIALGEPDEGIKQGQSALVIARELGTAHAEADALRALGEGHAAIRNRLRARALYEQALTIVRALGDRGREAECSWYLGRALISVEPQRALPLLHASVAYLQEIGHARSAECAAIFNRSYEARSRAAI